MAATNLARVALDSAYIAPEVFTLQPDYRALLMIVQDILPGSSDNSSERLLLEAEASARTLITQHNSVTSLPHVVAWQEAYKRFGAKPKKFRSSLEALTRRSENGLPRVNRLTDIYNAISVKHQIPIGGEDLDKYIGPPRLIRATGSEDFETTSHGEKVLEHPEVGEVVWCDDAGVTCRRWNWRQGPRTALTNETKNAIFILDALEPLKDEELQGAANEMVSALRQYSPDIRVVQRIMGAN